MSDWIGTALTDVIKATVALAAPVVAGLVVLLLKRLLAKAGLDVTEKQESRLKEIVVDRIHAAEEASRRDPMTSEEKHAKAVGEVMQVATADPTLPNPSVEHVAAKVDAELGKARAAGSMPSQPDPTLPGLGKR